MVVIHLYSNLIYDNTCMNYFVTTSIPYVNGEPHLGHALEFVYADVLARCARMRKTPTIFSTGTDEHGGKIAEKAAENKLQPKQYTDQIVQSFKELQAQLDISNDRFIRTTDPAHEQRAQMIWKNLSADIYKGSYEGWYCTGCETFVTDAMVKTNNTVCPDHNRPYEKLKEENYFFKLSKYQEKIKAAIESGAFRVVPATRKHEILHVIGEGLEDISISRPKDKISWGIAVPGDESQVMYVWFEALMNYITVLGYPEHQDFEKYWPANVQIVGKDILRFHAAIWPAMLLGLGLDLPRTLYVHGFILDEQGKKMSKSLGNVITPKEVLAKYSADVFRYYLMRYIPSYDDGNFSFKKMEEVYNNELANELGNAVRRTEAMITKYQDNVIGNIPISEHDMTAFFRAIEDCRFDRALDEVWERVRALNQYIDEMKPWDIAKKKDTAHLQEVLAYQVGSLLDIATLLEPFMPRTSVAIKHIFADGIVHPSEGTLFPRHDTPEPKSA